MHVYSDEDNEPMMDDFIMKYTAVINGKHFRETGELIITRTREESNNGHK